jgi:hypothetical protein
MYLTPVSLLSLIISASVCSCSLNNPRQDGLSMQANIPSNTNVKEPFNFTSVSNAVLALGPRCGPGNGECEHGLCCSPSGNSTDPRSHTCLTPDSGQDIAERRNIIAFPQAVKSIMELAMPAEPQRGDQLRTFLVLVLEKFYTAMEYFRALSPRLSH